MIFPIQYVLFSCRERFVLQKYKKNKKKGIIIIFFCIFAQNKSLSL